MIEQKLRVLFLCVHNSARSQIAEALMRQMAGDRVEVFSAGSDPTRVHPYALRVLQDEGIDASWARSKSVDEFANEHFDYAITLCAEEVCPISSNATHRFDWPLADPAAVDGSSEEQLAAFRATADELKWRVQMFLEAQLAPA